MKKLFPSMLVVAFLVLACKPESNNDLAPSVPTQADSLQGQSIGEVAATGRSNFSEESGYPPQVNTIDAKFADGTEYKVDMIGIVRHEYLCEALMLQPDSGGGVRVLHNKRLICLDQTGEGVFKVATSEGEVGYVNFLDKENKFDNTIFEEPVFDGWEHRGPLLVFRGSVQFVEWSDPVELKVYQPTNRVIEHLFGPFFIISHGMRSWGGISFVYNTNDSSSLGEIYGERVEDSSGTRFAAIGVPGEDGPVVVTVWEHDPADTKLKLLIDYRFDASLVSLSGSAHWDLTWVGTTVQIHATDADGKKISVDLIEANAGYEVVPRS